MYNKNMVVFDFLSKADERENRVIMNWKGFDVGFRLVLDRTHEGMMTIAVTESIAKEMELTEIELYELAKVNTPQIFPATFMGLNEVIAASFGGFAFPGMEEEIAYVLSNETGVKGATAILYPGIMETIKAKVPGDFYLVPSSVHELLVVPCKEMTKAEINQIINEVNVGSVDLEDQLGDEAVYFAG